MFLNAHSVYLPYQIESAASSIIIIFQNIRIS